MRPVRCRQGGFTLLEVLIATLIVGVGLLGIAGLQLANGVYAESGLHRSHASLLAQELFERMRVNVVEAKAGAYDIDTLPALATDCSGAAADCSAEQLREHDLRVWGGRVGTLLPAGDAAIATGPDDGENPVDIAITMSWASNRGQDAPISETFTFALMGLDQ